MIHETRIRYLNALDKRPGDFVLYWMQASPRAECNHALEHAIDVANGLGLPVVCFFGLMDKYPSANIRHYRFMMEGLRETSEALRARGIQLVVRLCQPEVGALGMEERAAVIITDRGYLRHQREWRQNVGKRAACGVIQVESDVVVPAEESSNKEEYAARTIRPKIRTALPDYLVQLNQREVDKDSLRLDIESLDIGDIDDVCGGLDVNRAVLPVTGFRGGASIARRLLYSFIEDKLDRYAEERNDPNRDALSNLSPYLHFGQISPIQIALAVSEQGGPGAEVFLEELIVRRELSINYVLHNSNYDLYDGLPDWARKTLAEHEKDEREFLYARDQFEEASTHDPYWNAAQREMVLTGKMHGYMRMYWGKKILEWSGTPREAFETAVYLNDKYELDGRDANGYAGVAWCFGKHDRPWARRPVFGTVRFMNDKGLKRKFDADAYVEAIMKIDAGSRVSRK